MLYLFILLLIIIILVSYIGAKDIPQKYLEFEPLHSRLLGMREEPYDDTRPEFTKIILKSGQRKLLFNEIEFYTYAKKTWAPLGRKFIVIYAGAAEGYHSDIIMELFPDFYFEYYDPRDFYKKLYKYKNLKIHQQFFKREDALKLYIKYQDRNKYFVLFLSDIRLGTEEEYIMPDMDNQREWCDCIKPDYAMLKFRLPWSSGRTEYYAGDIYTQPRIGPTSTEMRLWTDCKNRIIYDNQSYNDRCFYWNIHNRLAHHKIPKVYIKSIQGLCYCYDCWSEIDIIKKLFTNTKQQINLMNTIGKRFPINIEPHNIHNKNKILNK